MANIVGIDKNSKPFDAKSNKNFITGQEFLMTDPIEKAYSVSPH